MSQHDDETGLKPNGEARMVAKLATGPHAKEWWAGLPDNMRGAIIRKTAKAFMDAQTPRDIGTLSRALIAMDKLDFEREKLERGIQAPGNTFNGPVQINVGTDPVPKALQSKDGRNALDQLRRAISESDAAPAGEA